jgi:hypothetical protein
MRTLVLFTSIPLLAAITILPAHALTGSDLEKFCGEPPESMAGSSCRVYLRGLVDGLYLADKMAAEGRRLCSPNDKSIDVDQAKLVVQKYLKDHPEQLHRDGGVLAAVALYLAFPCK